MHLPNGLSFRQVQSVPGFWQRLLDRLRYGIKWEKLK